jgi:uncharacterized membrane protein YsdA (DUF1294 family)
MSDRSNLSWVALGAGLWWLAAVVLLAAGLLWPSLGVPWMLLVYCGATVAASVAAFCTYGIDKWLAASDAGQRVSERTLHWLDLLGGWPGGLVAQQLFRHKTQKASFGLVFWATVALHLAVLAWGAWRWAGG